MIDLRDMVLVKVPGDGISGGVEQGEVSPAPSTP